MAIITLVVSTCYVAGPLAQGWSMLVRLGLVLLIIRTFLSVVAIGGLTYGATPLLTLPQFHLSPWLGGLQLGGGATWEMLLNGLNSGIRLWSLMLLVGAFNVLTDQYALLRRTPRWLFGAGLIVMIAIAWIPQTLLQLQAIREAQRVRGHRLRGWRGALPLAVPLLTGGLERAMQLAEAMDSRGYARSASPDRHSLAQQALLLSGMILLALGLFAALGFQATARFGWSAALLGLLLLGLGIRSLRQSVVVSRYHRERWTNADRLVLGLSVIAATALLILQSVSPATLTYTPFPRATLPPFSPLVGAVTMLLTVPAVVRLATNGWGR